MDLICEKCGKKYVKESAYLKHIEICGVEEEEKMPSNESEVETKVEETVVDENPTVTDDVKEDDIKEETADDVITIPGKPIKKGAIVFR